MAEEALLEAALNLKTGGGGVSVPALYFTGSFFVAFPLPIFLFPGMVGVIMMNW